MEQWKEIEGFEGRYEVSDEGNVRSLLGIEPKLMKPGMHNSGYLYVILSVGDGTSKNVLVHRLVAEAFVPNPENKPDVNHKDGNKQNPCAYNLEWVTKSENMYHAYSSGIRDKNCTEGAVNANRRKVKCVETGQEFRSMADADRFLGCSLGQVSNIVDTARAIYGYHFVRICNK